jgi:hypothetical protein
MTTMPRSIVPLTLTFALAFPPLALAAPPEQTTAPEAAPVAAPTDGTQPQPVGDPATQPQTVPAPVYEPQPQPLQPQPLPPQPANRNRGLGLMIAGISVFSFSYLISVATGVVLIDSNNEEIGRPLLIPLAGPFIAIGRTGSATAGLGLGFAGIAQIAGFGMAIGGSVMFARSRYKARLSVAPGGLQLRF